MTTGAAYSLLDADVLQKLEDEEFFLGVMDTFYKRVSGAWGCEVQMSARRLGDAYGNWMDDADRTVTHGFRETIAAAISPQPKKKLDHFKIASIVAFWLRRSCPINETYPLSQTFNWEAARDFNIDTDASLFEALDAPQKHYLDFGNELTALLAGFQIVLGGEISIYEANLKKKGQRLQPGARQKILQGIQLSDTFLMEYPRLCKTKNLSWHGIFMNYHSLFERLDIVHGSRP